jgi:hypothetical protein
MARRGQPEQEVIRELKRTDEIDLQPQPRRVSESTNGNDASRTRRDIWHDSEPMVRAVGCRVRRAIPQISTKASKSDTDCTDNGAHVSEGNCAIGSRFPGCFTNLHLIAQSIPRLLVPELGAIEVPCVKADPDTSQKDSAANCCRDLANSSLRTANNNDGRGE